MFSDATSTSFSSWAIGIAGLPSTVGLIAKVFDYWDPLLSDTGRSTLTKFLQGQALQSDPHNWSQAFANVIDQVFGKRPFSVSFFLRSCIASCIAFACVLLAIIGLEPQLLESASQIWILLLLTLLANSLPDYFSLLISRSILHRMALRPTLRHVSLLLILDLVLKVCVATLGILIGSLAIHVGLSLAVGLHEDIWHASFNSVIDLYSALPLAFVKTNSLAFGILFYSSFFTSVWVWLYIAGLFSARALVTTRGFWEIFAEFLNVEKFPLRSIGIVIAAAVAVLYIAVFMTSFLLK